MGFRRKPAPRRSAAMLSRKVGLAIEVLEPRLPFAIELISTPDPAELASDWASGDSYRPDLSADGRYLVFHSDASNLVAGDSNGVTDVFVQDRATGQVSRVSEASDGQEGAWASFNAQISGNGRYVVFESAGNSFDSGNGLYRTTIFRKDLLTGDLTIASTDASGAAWANYANRATISDDGIRVAFESDGQVYVKDLATGDVSRASENPVGEAAITIAYDSRISGDGWHVAFVSRAVNLVDGDVGTTEDIFVKDLANGAIDRASTPAGVSALSIARRPTLSADGRFVAFYGFGIDITTTATFPTRGRGYVKDLETGVVTNVTEFVQLNGQSQIDHVQISRDGQFVVFDASVIGEALYRRNLTTGEVTTVIDLGAYPFAYSGGDFATNADASAIAFATLSPSVLPGDINASVDIFVWNASDGSLDRATSRDPNVAMSTRFGESAAPSVDGSGNLVVYEGFREAPAFGSAPIRDIFLYNRATGETTLVSATVDGTRGDADSTEAAISRNGRYVVFSSRASTFAPDRTSGVYRKDLVTGELILISDGGIVRAGAAAISDSGAFIAFEGRTQEDGSYSASEIYWRDMHTGEVRIVSRAQSHIASSYDALRPSISGDGQFVAFDSDDFALDGMANGRQIFVRDVYFDVLIDGSTYYGTYADGDSFGGVLSGDGRWLVFSSYAENFHPDAHGPQIYVKNLSTGVVTWVSRQFPSATTPPLGMSFDIGGGKAATISGDGRYIAYVTGWNQVVVVDGLYGVLSRITPPSSRVNGSGSPALSADGDFVAFDSILEDLIAGDENGRRDVFGVEDINYAPANLLLSSIRAFEAGGLVGAFATLDIDSDQFTYTLVPGNYPTDAAKFNIVGNELFLAEPIDFYPGAAAQIRVRTTDSDGQSFEREFIIEIWNSPPGAMVDANAADNIVVENPLNGAATGLVAQAIDPGGGTVAYSLLDDAGGRFAIHASTGVVTVTNRTLINYETQSSHTVRVRAVDQYGLATVGVFVIQVANVAPSWASTPTGVSVGENIANGTSIATITATDPNGATLSYSIVGNSAFAISSTGHLSVADASFLDYESSDGVIVLRLRVEDDGGLFAERDLTVNIVNRAPTDVIDLDSSANIAWEGATEGALVGITAQGVDPQGGATTYTLLTHTDKFAIDSQTGIVTVATGYVIDADVLPSNLSLGVRATDPSGLGWSRSFSVAVGNLPPSIPIDSDPAPNVVYEGWTAGTPIGLTLSSTDPAGGNITYQIINDPLFRFRFDTTSPGVVVVNSSGNIDYETATGPYVVEVRARDKFGAVTVTTFEVEVRNSPPRNLRDVDAGDNTISEQVDSGATVGIRAAATDNGGSAVTFSLVDSADGRFAIDAATGVITVVDGSRIDFESSGGTYDLRFRAADSSDLGVESVFTITVTNEPVGELVDSDGAVNSVSEGAAVGTTVGITAIALDPGGGAVNYALVDNAGGRFAIDAVTGLVTVLTPALIDFESSGGSYTIVVAASDAEGVASTAEWTIGVTNQGPAVPVDSDGAANSVSEAAAVGTTVGITATAIDPGGGAVNYALVDNAGGRFAIDAVTGLVTVLTPGLIDFESSGGSYSIVVSASDAEGVASTAEWTIGVTNRAPSAPVDTNGALNIVGETLRAGSAVGITVAAADPHGGVIWYSLVDSAGGLFSVEPTTGIVRVQQPAALEDVATRYGIRVRATDAGGAWSEGVFTIQVRHEILAVAANAGNSKVVVYDAASHAMLATFMAFPKNYKGGVRVATGDVNGDGTADLVVSSGAGIKTRVSVYDGTKLHLLGAGGVISPAALIASIAPFGGGYKGGAFLALADINRDQRSEIIVGSGASRAGEVRVFDGANFALLRSFKPFGGGFKGGVNVAAGDLNGDRVPDIVAARATGRAQVRIYDGLSGGLFATLKPFGKAMHGVDVAVGDVNGDGRSDLIVAAGPDAAPSVRVLSGVDYGLIADFLAYKRRFKAGVQLAVLDANGDGRSEIFTGSGKTSSPVVRKFEWTGALVEQLFAGDRAFKGGVNLD